MEKPLVILLLLCSLSAQAQRYKIRKQVIVGAGLGFVAGAAHGTHEKIVYHYPTFQKRWPNANPQYWNPDVSWTNKYKNNDPEQGRNGKPVVLTDAKHLLVSTTQVTLFGAGVCITIGERRPIWHYAIDAVIVGIFRSVGNELAFDTLYRNH